MPNSSAVPGLGRIVAASMVFGLVSAIVLAVLPFAGAPENVIWGVVLLGFAFGWAVLAAASAMWTASPQRWAWLPAATLALAGIALLAWPRASSRSGSRGAGRDRRPRRVHAGGSYRPATAQH